MQLCVVLQGCSASLGAAGIRECVGVCGALLGVFHTSEVGQRCACVCLHAGSRREVESCDYHSIFVKHLLNV